MVLTITPHLFFFPNCSQNRFQKMRKFSISRLSFPTYAFPSGFPIKPAVSAPCHTYAATLVAMRPFICAHRSVGLRRDAPCVCRFDLSLRDLATPPHRAYVTLSFRFVALRCATPCVRCLDLSLRGLAIPPHRAYVTLSFRFVTLRYAAHLGLRRDASRVCCFDFLLRDLALRRASGQLSMKA